MAGSTKPTRAEMLRFKIDHGKDAFLREFGAEQDGRWWLTYEAASAYVPTPVDKETVKRWGRIGNVTLGRSTGRDAFVLVDDLPKIVSDD